MLNELYFLTRRKPNLHQFKIVKNKISNIILITEKIYFAGERQSRYFKNGTNINTEDPDPDPFFFEMLDPDPDPYIMYTDPQPWPKPKSGLLQGH